MQDERRATIESLPAEVRDCSLVPWKTVAVILGLDDVENVREIVIAAGVPLVHVSERRKLPRWRDIRDFMDSREVRHDPLKSHAPLAAK